jgi:hypothetical protein
MHSITQIKMVNSSTNIVQIIIGDGFGLPTGPSIQVRRQPPFTYCRIGTGYSFLGTVSSQDNVPSELFSSACSVRQMVTDSKTMSEN